MAKNGQYQDENGAFKKGNPGGPGNPLLREGQRLRLAMLREIKAEDLAAVVHKLIDLAKNGEPWAIKEVLNRTLGKQPLPIQLVPRDEPVDVESEEVKPRLARPVRPGSPF